MRTGVVTPYNSTPICYAIMLVPKVFFEPYLNPIATLNDIPVETPMGET